ncbi:MAG: HNH endonuclease, partial [Lachnospiraceae bacterium]|nr:HNH endonuclease [Lachnospiraceae bacterium]
LGAEKGTGRAQRAEVKAKPDKAPETRQSRAQRAEVKAKPDKAPETRQSRAQRAEVKNEEKKTPEQGYLSTYEDRISHTPRDDGEKGNWTGARGESIYKPKDIDAKKELHAHGLQGIEYQNGVPDFTPCAKETVSITDMTSNRFKNFEQCDRICAERWNERHMEGKTDWDARKVADYRREHSLTWHERNDRTHCDLVPTNIHEECRHLGGVSECKKANL